MVQPALGVAGTTAVLARAMHRGAHLMTGITVRSLRGLGPFLCSLMVASCSRALEETPGGPAGSENEEYGLGAKADDGGCDPGADFCWPSEDLAAMRVYARVQRDLMLEIGDADAALDTLIEIARSIDHRLTDDELESLAQLEAVAARPPNPFLGRRAMDLATDLERTVMRRPIGTYYAAHMVQVGAQATAESSPADESGPSDYATGDGELEPGDGSGDGYTEGMRQSLDMLSDAGALGHAYRVILELSGVLEEDFDVINAENFGSYDAQNQTFIPLGLSREERTNRIVEEYQRAAGFVGLVAGAESLIPIAGVPISIAHETYKLFELHTRMAFEIAAVYGWDIREGRNLFRVATMMLSEGSLAEMADVLASNVAIPLIARAVARRLGIELSDTLAKQLAQRSLAQIMRIFTRSSQEAIAEAAITGGAKAVGRQLFGYATLGLAVLASGAIDYAVTGLVGRHVELVAKRWVADLMLEGATYLGRPEARDCAFETIATMAWSDGRLDDLEWRYFVALTAKPYQIDERAWQILTSSERRRHGATLAQQQDERGQPACVDTRFGRSQPTHRMALLAYVYGMAVVDSHFDAREEALYSELRDSLEGRRIFGPARINDVHMDYIERAVYLMLQPGVVDVGEEYAELTSRLMSSDVIGYMAESDPDAEADVRCGYRSDCPSPGGACEDSCPH